MLILGINFESELADIRQLVFIDNEIYCRAISHHALIAIRQ